MQAPRIRIAVAIDDDSVRGTIKSPLKAVLRSLGDVDLVELTEDPNFVVIGMFMCTPNPSCVGYDGVMGFLRIAVPLTRSDLAIDIRQSGIRATDSTINRLARFLDDYEKPQSTTLYSWGRNRIETGARAAASEIDATCLEAFRSLARAFAIPDQQARSNAIEVHFSKKWHC
jgi:hypothetical protein